MRALANHRRSGEFRVLHYSLQRDHAHFVIEASHRFALARGMKALGQRMAWIARKAFGWRGALLDGRYHSRVLKTPREVRNAIAYTLLNARKHLAERLRRTAAGASAVMRALSEARIDPASSGPWFTGWRRAPAPVPQPPPVSEPRTWLAVSGWRGCRLLDPAEVPGSRQGLPARRSR